MGFIFLAIEVLLHTQVFSCYLYCHKQAKRPNWCHIQRLALTWTSRTDNNYLGKDFIHVQTEFVAASLCHADTYSIFILLLLLSFKALKRKMWLKYPVWIGRWALRRFCRCCFSTHDVMMVKGDLRWIQALLLTCLPPFSSPDKTLAICRHAGSNLLQKGPRNEGRVCEMRQNFQNPEMFKVIK